MALSPGEGLGSRFQLPHNLRRVARGSQGSNPPDLVPNTHCPAPERTAWPCKPQPGKPRQLERRSLRHPSARCCSSRDLRHRTRASRRAVEHWGPSLVQRISDSIRRAGGTRVRHEVGRIAQSRLQRATSAACPKCACASYRRMRPLATSTCSRGRVQAARRRGASVAPPAASALAAVTNARSHRSGAMSAALPSVSMAANARDATSLTTSAVAAGPAAQTQDPPPSPPFRRERTRVAKSPMRAIRSSRRRSPQSFHEARGGEQPV